LSRKPGRSLCGTPEDHTACRAARCHQGWRLRGDTLDTGELQRREEQRGAGGPVAPPEGHGVLTGDQRWDVARHQKATVVDLAEGDQPFGTVLCGPDQVGPVKHRAGHGNVRR